MKGAFYEVWFLAQAQLPSLNGDSRNVFFHIMAASFRWPFSMFEQTYRRAMLRAKHPLLGFVSAFTRDSRERWDDRRQQW